MIATVPGIVAGVAVCATWIYLALGRGGFWRCVENDRAMHRAATAGRLARASSS